MAEHIAGYAISSSNKNGIYDASITVRKQGVILVKLRMPFSNALTRIRKDASRFAKCAPQRAEFVAECYAVGMAREDVEEILKISK